MVAFLGKQNEDQTITFPDNEVRRMYAHIAELERNIENLKAVFRVNMIRAYPTMTHEEVTTAIEVALCHERVG